jgi:hypothetical protein
MSFGRERSAEGGSAAREPDAVRFRVIAHSDLGGYGDGMQVLREGDALYVGHFGISGMGTSILDVEDAGAPAIVAQWRADRGTHSHKVQVADGLLLVNDEQFRGGAGHTAGMRVYDLRGGPALVGRLETGGLGVHRIVYTGGRYAHASATPVGFADRIWIVIDLADREHPVEAARWWLDEPAPPGKRYAAHHALLDGDVAYLGYGDAGMVVLDVADITRPKQIARLEWGGGDTHTCLPLPRRKLVVVTDEQVVDGPAEERLVRVIDVADPAAPRVVGVCPPPPRAYDQLRFGPHNLHENRPGSFVSERFVFVTYFSGGLVVYDLEDPAAPKLAAHWQPGAPPGQPAPQTNDLFVERSGRVWATDRIGGGLHGLELHGRQGTVILRD